MEAPRIRNPLGNKLLLTAVVLVFLYNCYSMGLNASFWLDETITAWVISSGFDQIKPRVFAFQAQSPLYYWFVGLVAQTFGIHEWLLRLPSILFGIGSLTIVYKIASRNLSNTASYAALIILLIHPDFNRALLAARPYSMALFFSLAAIWYFVQWLDKRQIVQLALSVLFSLIAFYTHYLFVFTLAPILLAALVCLSTRREGIVAPLLGGLVLSLIVAIPGFLHLLSISKLSDVYSFASALSAKNIFSSIIPIATIIASIMAGALVFAFCKGLKLHRQNIPQRFFSFALVWAFIPPIIITLISFLLGHSLLVSRYYLLASVGVALTISAIVAAVTEKKHQALFTLILALFSFFIFQWHFEDWRAVSARLASRTTESSIVLLHSGLIEGEHQSWLLKQENREYLTAPLLVYPVKGLIYPIPRILESEEVEQLRFFLPILTQKPQVIVVVNMKSPVEFKKNVQSRTIEFYSQLLINMGYKAGEYWNQEMAEIQEFSRD